MEQLSGALDMPWGGLFDLPAANLIVAALALGGALWCWKLAHPGEAGVTDSARRALYCLSGPFASAEIHVPDDGLYIGRLPDRAQLVLQSPLISRLHVRVWPDRGGAGIWLEDWSSLNGTSYGRAIDPGSDHRSWRALRGRILLPPGARFRLANHVAEFEVRT
jgi:hypothetical protein